MFGIFSVLTESWCRVCFLTPPGRLEAVEHVDSLDVVGEGGVGEKRSVSVDGVQSEFKGQFLRSRRPALYRLKDTSCRQTEHSLLSQLQASHTKSHLLHTRALHSKHIILYSLDIFLKAFFLKCLKPDIYFIILQQYTENQNKYINVKIKIYI